MKMEKDAKIYVAGHRGLVGSAIVRRLEKEGFSNLVTRTHSELAPRRTTARHEAEKCGVEALGVNRGQFVTNRNGERLDLTDARATGGFFRKGSRSVSNCRRLGKNFKGAMASGHQAIRRCTIPGPFTTKKPCNNQGSLDGRIAT